MILKQAYKSQKWFDEMDKVGIKGMENIRKNYKIIFGKTGMGNCSDYILVKTN